MSIEPEDQEKISGMAEKIYKEINEERVARNLPPFDDSLPKTVENLNSLHVASFKEEGWDGWGSHLPANDQCVRENVDYLASKD